MTSTCMMNLNDSLNEHQMEAANTLEGPVLVLAGAGSGKTRVVTYRIVNLINSGVNPNEIVGLTFTNKAAQEMKERIQKLTNSDVLICTFHSFGVRILRESIDALGFSRDFIIYDAADSERLLKECLKEMGLKEKEVGFKTLKSMLSQSKNDLVLPDDVDVAEYPSNISSVFPTLYSLYQRKLKSYNALDFDDLLFLTARLFREHPDVLERYQRRYSHMLIDEYQDTNEAQYRIVRSLMAKRPNLFVVGDPDQSIYSWRGANMGNILSFEEDYPGAKVVRLEQNYRSRSNILEAANALIGFNDNRYDKHLWSDLGQGESIKHFTGEDAWAEAKYVANRIRFHQERHGIPLSQMVIFYRTNAQSRIFEDLFLQERIPYVIVGGISFYQRREIKDILAFLRVVYSGSDFISFARTLNLPKRGIGDASLVKLREGAVQEDMPIFEFCEALVSGVPMQASVKLPKKQMEGLAQYVSLIRELRAINESSSLKALVTAAVHESGYLSLLREDPESFADREENLESLVNKAVEWEIMNDSSSLRSFLEELSLKGSIDEANMEGEKVNLMTIHNGKGLEFAVTFLVGMEEDLFPHVNSRESYEALEEERRLCYVGMTRAKEFLYLTEARFRNMWGMARTMRPSRFLKEVPPEYIEKVRPVRRSRW